MGAAQIPPDAQLQLVVYLAGHDAEAYVFGEVTRMFTHTRKRAHVHTRHAQTPMHVSTHTRTHAARAGPATRAFARARAGASGGAGAARTLD